MDIKEELQLSILTNETLVGEMDIEYSEQMANAAANLILCPADISDEDMREMEQKILDIYKYCVENFVAQNPISFSSVFEEVARHNDEIFETLADLEYAYGPQHYLDEHIERCAERGSDPDEEFDETSSFMCQEWTEYYYDNYMEKFDSLDTFVAYVLDKYRCAYSFEKYDVPYDDTYANSIVIRNQGAIFINNDAQNVVMFELMNFGFAGYSDFLNYHQGLDMTKGTLLLGSGKKDGK